MPYSAKRYKPPGPPPRDDRPNSAARGYGASWRKLRAAVIASRPVCEECGREPSLHVDHVVSRHDGGGDHEDNLRALCASCHSRKTFLEDGAFGRPRASERG
jgi:5-methylcytosine-specific restriction protein A